MTLPAIVAARSAAVLAMWVYGPPCLMVRQLLQYLLHDGGGYARPPHDTLDILTHPTVANMLSLST